jgi:hypothetical protein
MECPGARCRTSPRQGQFLAGLVEPTPVLRHGPDGRLHAPEGLRGPLERQLQYRYFDKGGTDLELADLGLRRDPLKGGALDQGVEHLRPIVEKALKEALNASELNYDKQGDLPVRFGSAMVFVRLLGGPKPMVRVFSPLLWELSTTAGVLEALNDINTRISIGRVFWTGDNVVAAIDLPAPGLSGEYVSMACFEIGSLADHFDEELAQRFGGKTMFGQDSPEEPPAAPGYL